MIQARAILNSDLDHRRKDDGCVSLYFYISLSQEGRIVHILLATLYKYVKLCPSGYVMGNLKG